jgi:signal peptidase II
MKLNHRLILFITLFVALIGCDRVTKEMAKDHLIGKGTLTYFFDTVRLVYVENTGAFLGLGSELPKTAGYLLFIFLPMIFVVLLAVYLIVKNKEIRKIPLLSYTLILSGGTGNLIDRVLFDMHVTDFLNFGIGGLRTGILNLADFYVTVGIILLLLFSKQLNPEKPAPEPNENPA